VPPEHHLSAANEKSRYETHQNRPDDQGYRDFLSRLTKQLVPRLKAGACGLDYGAGPGPTLSLMLKEQGFTMFTYDPYFAPFTSTFEKKYDFITCTEVVEHFFYPRMEFEQFVLLLKNGGHLGIMTDILDSDARFSDWYYHRDPTHVCFYKKETFEWIADWLGWNVEFPAKNVAIFIKANG
jgi:2-polyprenyl-3-methyl-5-hydroxy-6-metoxy-1,4-benzoquinol methylase